MDFKPEYLKQWSVLFSMKLGVPYSPIQKGYRKIYSLYLCVTHRQLGQKEKNKKMEKKLKCVEKNRKKQKSIATTVSLNTFIILPGHRREAG